MPVPTGPNRTIRMARLAANAIRKPHGGHQLAPRPSVAPDLPAAVASDLHEVTDRLGLPRVTVHSLRHSTAITLIANGYPIAKVAAMLGHSSSRVTEMVYSHLTGDDIRDAAAVMERRWASDC
jgi:integrase